MKSIRNNIQLIGRLGKDPEFKSLENGSTLAKFSLATKDVYKNGKGEKVIDTQWHNIIAWGKLAENINVFLKKGYEVALNGKLTHGKFEGKDGVKRYFTEVVASEFMLLSQPSKNNDA